jgi:hypothetical protein
MVVFSIRKSIEDSTFLEVVVTGLASGRNVCLFCILHLPAAREAYSDKSENRNFFIRLVRRGLLRDQRPEMTCCHCCGDQALGNCQRPLPMQTTYT